MSCSGAWFSCQKIIDAINITIKDYDRKRRSDRARFLNHFQGLIKKWSWKKFRFIYWSYADNIFSQLNSDGAFEDFLNFVKDSSWSHGTNPFILPVSFPNIYLDFGRPLSTKDSELLRLYLSCQKKILESKDHTSQIFVSIDLIPFLNIREMHENSNTES